MVLTCKCVYLCLYKCDILYPTEIIIPPNNHQPFSCMGQQDVCLYMYIRLWILTETKKIRNQIDDEGNSNRERRDTPSELAFISAWVSSTCSHHHHIRRYHHSSYTPRVSHNTRFRSSYYSVGTLKKDTIPPPPVFSYCE